MGAIIVANGQLNQAIQANAEDLLIAADGGALHCLAQGLAPSFVVGDLDSLQPEQISQLESLGAKFLRFPSRKDQTDLELALDLVERRGIPEVLILGALGERWDQTIANLLLSASRSSIQIRMLDGHQEFYFLRGGAQIEINGQPGDIVSLIPLGGEALGITTQNLEYPLKGEDLPFGSTRGVSNTLLDRRGVVSLEKGYMLCTVIHI